MNYFLLVVLTCIYFTCSAQVNFQDYVPIKSVGTVPDDFKKLTFEKVEEGLSKEDEVLSKSNQKQFLTKINYSIDAILNSGYVTFGDPLSNYVNEVADVLLKEEPSLREKLRFYILKTTDVNAFSTNQGIILVTTGLLAQMNSEAHLALILAHEIAHFTKNHVREQFEISIDKRKRNAIPFNTYSKEKELEADRFGLELFYDAGYSNAEVLNTFDILMYSYLPFDEVKFDPTYFNTKDVFIPENLFTKTNFPIKAVEDFNDENSTHPNIKKRKEAIQTEMEGYKNWGTKNSFLSDVKFQEVRNIARFETLRQELLNSNYANALYAIYLLEKVFPNSNYLKRMKAHAWLGLAIYKEASEYGDTYTKKSKLEGESAPLHVFIGGLSKLELYALSSRFVMDYYLNNKKDQEAIAMKNKLIDILAVEPKFDIKSFSEENFETSKSNALKLKPAQTETSSNSSKYEKIKKAKAVDSSTIPDSTNYHFYALADLVKDKSFFSDIVERRNEMSKKWNKVNKIDGDEFNDFALVDYMKKCKTNSTLTNDSFVFVEPEAEFSANNNKKQSIQEKSTQLYSELVLDVSTDLNLKAFSIGRKDMNYNGTETFNDRSVIKNAFNQLAKENVSPFPVDYGLLDEIGNRKNTHQILFSYLEYDRNKFPVAAALSAGVFFFPALVAIVPTYFFQRHNTTITNVMFDLQQGSICDVYSVSCNINPKKLVLRGFVYDYLSRIRKGS